MPPTCGLWIDDRSGGEVPFPLDTAGPRTPEDPPSRPHAVSRCASARAWPQPPGLSLMGLEHEEHFREACLVPALSAGLIEMTIPDKPTGHHQDDGFFRGTMGPSIYGALRPGADRVRRCRPRAAAPCCFRSSVPPLISASVSSDRCACSVAMRLYLDTSVLGALADSDDPQRSRSPGGSSAHSPSVRISE